LTRHCRHFARPIVIVFIAVFVVVVAVFVVAVFIGVFVVIVADGVSGDSFG
jgi:hypothetical protein